MNDDYETMNTDELRQRTYTEQPNNSDQTHGYALINVLKTEQFEEEHIPYSINVPGNRLEEVDRAFDKQKEIIVYCASQSCDASLNAAEKLSDMGFRNVKDYEAGLKGWKEAGEPTVSGSIQRATAS